MPRLGFAMALALALAGCPRREGPSQVQLVFAADQLGFIAPCGCSRHQLGGAARASAELLALADGGPSLFVEGGNALFGASDIPPEKLPQDREKAAALLRAWDVGLSVYRARAYGEGPYDRALGESFAAETLGPRPLLKGPELVELAGVKIGLLPLAAEPANAQAAAGLRAEGARAVVALVQGPFARAAQWAQAAGADLALQSGVADPVQDTDEAAVTTGAVPVFRVKDKGRGLLALRFQVPASASAGGVVLAENGAEREKRAAALGAVIASYEKRLATAEGPLRSQIAKLLSDQKARRAALAGPPPAPPADRVSVAYRFIDLDETLPEDPAAAAVFAEYTRSIGEENLAAQAQKVCPAVDPKVAHFVGAESCRACHPRAYDVYVKTAHTQAYQKLVEKGRQYDLDCIGCHVVGYGKPGGVCRLDQVGALANVQCESCHGMGSAHAEDGAPIPVAKPGFDTCYRCHDPENDTGFNHETFVSRYLPGVLGPGHGLK